MNLMSTARCPCKVPKGESIVSSRKFSSLIPTFAIQSLTYVLTSLHLELHLTLILALISSSSYWGRFGASMVFSSIGVGLEGDALEFGQRRTRKAVVQDGRLQWMHTAVLCDPICSSCAQLFRHFFAMAFVLSCMKLLGPHRHRSITHIGLWETRSALVLSQVNALWLAIPSQIPDTQIQTSSLSHVCSLQSCHVYANG